MTKYQIDEAESTAVDLSIYESLFHLCILIFGRFFFCGCFDVVGFFVGGFLHRADYFCVKKLHKTSFHKIKLN